MSKYTPAELKQAAQIVLEDKRRLGERSLRLIMTLAGMYQTAPADIIARIEELAQ